MKKLLILALFTAVTFCAAAQELTVATYNLSLIHISEPTRRS